MGCKYNIQGRLQFGKYFQNCKYKSRSCHSSEILQTFQNILKKITLKYLRGRENGVIASPTLPIANPEMPVNTITKPAQNFWQQYLYTGNITDVITIENANYMVHRCSQVGSFGSFRGHSLLFTFLTKYQLKMMLEIGGEREGEWTK